MKVLLVGNISGVSRSQLLIQSLMNFYTDKSYVVGFCGTDFYTKNISSDKQKLSIFYKLYFLIDLFIKMGASDIIYIMAMNHQFIKPVLLHNKFWKKKIITDFYTSAYDTGIDRGLFLNDTPQSRKIKNKLISYDRLMLENSDMLIHLTKGDLEYIAELINVTINYSKVKIIPLGIEAKKEAHPTPSKIFRIVWWGTWIPLHGIENILNAIKYLVETEPNVRLDMYGVDNPSKEIYKKIIVELNIADKVFIHTDKSFANKKLEKELEYNCDLALGNFGNSQKAEHVIVNKIIDAFSMKLPVITMKNKVLHEFIDIDNDLFVSTNNPQYMAKTIADIIRNPDESRRRARNGYNCYQKYFTPKIYTDEALSVIDNIMLK